MEEHLYEHFCDNKHSDFLNEVSITLTRPTLPTLFKEKVIGSILENICTIWLKHKGKCVDVSLLILISFTLIGIVCVVVAALTIMAYHC